MDKNTDERLVVMDRAQFNKLHAFAYHGAHDDGVGESFAAILRHVHKFNPHIPNEDGEDKALELERQRSRAKLARYWRRYRPAQTVYLRGELYQTRQGCQPYLMPVVVIGRAQDGVNGEPMVMVEFQAHDDYQRESFLFQLRTCQTSRDGQYPRFNYQLFNGQPVPGGQGIAFKGRWSHRQHTRLTQGKYAKLHIAVEVQDLVETLPSSATPCSGLFRGFYFQPTN